MNYLRSIVIHSFIIPSNLILSRIIYEYDTGKNHFKNVFF